MYNFQKIFFIIIDLPDTISYSSPFLSYPIPYSPGNQVNHSFHEEESTCKNSVEGRKEKKKKKSKETGPVRHKNISWEKSMQN